MSSTRPASATGQVAGIGFADRGRASDAIAALDLSDVARENLLDGLAESADPDQALRWIVDIAAAEDGVTAVLDDAVSTRALTAITGMSDALGEFLVRHPRVVGSLGAVEAARPPADHLRDRMLAAVGADPVAATPVAAGADARWLDAMRIAYRECLVEIAVRDLVNGSSLDDIAAELADLADAALDAGLAIARADLPQGSEPCRLAVIGMGKCGGQELNYVSDVDVIFVAEALPGGDEEAALRAATRLATGLIRACGEPTAEGVLWEVDAALRPEGKQGALVRTLASHVGYYERWASTWEFQALLKARPAAGDRELGRAYVDAMSEMVWAAADRPDFVGDVQRMRRRVIDHIPAREMPRQLKLGPGGLRDVEFSVQLLQLVHGRSDVTLRSPTTLTALEALATWGYVGREDGATLASAYRFLRTLEHRIQLHRLKRTHVVPEGEEDLRRLGRSLGFRADPVEQLTEEWRRHAREVRRLHEKLFYRPLLQAVARLDAGAARLTPEAAEQRLEALGYRDPEGALRHLEALSGGVSRRAAIQRTLLPVLLGWFADGPDPDAALLGFRRMSDDLGSTPWYLRLLRDESLAAERMARLLSSSRYVSDLLLRSPDGLMLLADDAEVRPRNRESLVAEAVAAIGRHEDPDVAVGALRALRRRELFRVSASEALGLIDVERAMVALTDVADATLIGTVEVATRVVAAQHGGTLPTRFTVIGMGRLGGREMGYGSDADVMFVHDPLPGVEDRVAADAALAVANEMRRLLSAPSPDPALAIDADLRPEGRQGPLVRTLGSYRAYYERWSSPWEAQALLRASPVAGSTSLGEEFIALIDPLRWPEEGLEVDALRQMRRLKARMESERLPRGADPALHTKLGRGGLSDVEWVAQLLQLSHAHAVPGLRTTRTLPALAAAVDAGLLDESDAETLRSAWLLASRVRAAIVLARGSASDAIPSAVADLAPVAALLGYPPGEPAALLEDYRRATRRARVVVERVFYGEEAGE